jgi:hypothetical protein
MKKHFINLFNMFLVFKQPCHKKVAQEHLQDSQREVLIHASKAGYHTKMVEYYEENVSRLLNGMETKAKVSTNNNSANNVEKLRPTKGKQRLSAA